MEIPKGYFKITSRYINKTNFCLDINGGMSEDGTEIISYTSHKGLQQIWKYDNGTFINLLIGKAIDLNNNIIILNTISGALSQKWTIDQVGRIQSNLTKQYLTLDEKNNNKLFMSYDLESNFQRWYFDVIQLTVKQQTDVKNSILKVKNDEINNAMQQYKFINGISNNVHYTPEEMVKRAEQIKNCSVECGENIDR